MGSSDTLDETRAAASPPLAWIHRLWFGGIVVAQVTFLLTMPAFNGSDERGHFIRMWAVAEGHFSCKTLPAAVREVDRMRGGGGTARGWVKQERLAAYFARGLAFQGRGVLVKGWDYECSYVPTALLAPAAVTRIVAKTVGGEIRRGGVFLSSYAARLTLALLFDLAVLLLLRAAPWGRTTTLAFCSIPEVLHQSFCIGHDSFLVAVTMLVLVAALRPPSWRAVGFMLLAVLAMAMIKPVYAPFALLALPMLARLHERRPFGPWQWIASLSVALPACGYPILRMISPDTGRMWHPGFANPSRQAAYLVAHPLHVFQVFAGYLHYFIDDHALPDFFPRLINGKWTTLFGVFGNSEFEMALPGFILVLVGLAVALGADVIRPPAEPAPASRSRWSRWARRLAVVGALAPVPLTVVALYLVFSPIGARGPYGVHGRYHQPSMVLAMVLGVYVLRHRLRLARHWGPWPDLVACVAMLASDAVALVSVYRHYWL